MRLSTFLAGASGLLVVGLLGFRIVNLEQQVNQLAKQLGPAPEATGAPAVANAPATVGQTTRALEDRVASLEKRLESLSKTRSAPISVAGPGANNLQQEEAILSVIERENSRIRDVQLEWHKARWLETRKQQLALFASQLNLQPAQSAELFRALEEELNSMTDVMRRPTFAEEPDQVAADWQKIITETDKRAKATLSPEQFAWWQQGRIFERKTLWPWLPDNSQETAQR
jgi:hypothetical protein